MQLLALDETLGQQNLRMLQTQGQTHQEIAIILLTPESEIAARRSIAESFLPIQRTNGRFDVMRAHPARIQAADDRPHARARNAIDRDFQIFKDFEYADVRDAASAAAR